MIISKNILVGYTENKKPIYKREIRELTQEEINELQQNQFKPNYEELVIQFIREKYSIDQELAILRQRDTKPNEFNTYNDYVESCKERAKKETSHS